MGAPRQTFIDLLQTEFEKNTKLADECKSSADEKLKEGLATRFFDSFPCLMPVNELILLTHELRRILICMDPASIVENKNTFVLTDEDDRNDIFEWQMKIISYGVSVLLDEKGCVNPELLKLLNVNHQKVDPWEILCAFVAQVNQHIILQFEKQFKQLRIDNHFVFNMIFLHVNKRYGKWIKVFLSIHDAHLSAELETFTKPLMDIILKLNQTYRRVSSLKTEEKLQIHQWQTHILREIIDNKLDEEGQIQHAFLNRYHLNDTKVTPEEFIFMYLENINHHIWESQKTFFEKHATISQLIFDHIKIHKSSWIKDELPTAGYVLITPKINFTKPEYQPSPGVLLVLGATLATASAGYASYMFFKNAKDTSKPGLEKMENRKISSPA